MYDRYKRKNVRPKYSYNFDEKLFCYINVNKFNLKKKKNI